MRSLIRTLSGLTIVMLVSACAITVPNPVEPEIVQIEVKSSFPISITQAYVYRHDGKTILRGEAAFPTWRWFGNFTGHIDIEVSVPGSDAVKMNNISLTRMRIPKKRGRRAIFVSKIADSPTNGTIVHVSYHEGEHEMPTIHG